MDFVILDYEFDPEVPFILGCPLLATKGALIDVIAGQLTMHANYKVKVFDIYKALKLLIVYKDLEAITVLDTEVVVSQVEINDPLAKVLLNQRLVDNLEAREIESVFNNHNASMLKKVSEPLNRLLGPSPKPSIKEAPQLELKSLP